MAWTVTRSREGLRQMIVVEAVFFLLILGQESWLLPKLSRSVPGIIYISSHCHQIPLSAMGKLCQNSCTAAVICQLNKGHSWIVGYLEKWNKNKLGRCFLQPCQWTVGERKKGEENSHWRMVIWSKLCGEQTIIRIQNKTYTKLKNPKLLLICN